MPSSHESAMPKKNSKDRLDFDNPDFVFVPKGHHKYRQEGPYLVCYSCKLKHAIWVGMNKILTGFKKDGTPILKKR